MIISDSVIWNHTRVSRSEIRSIRTAAEGELQCGIPNMDYVDRTEDTPPHQRKKRLVGGQETLPVRDTTQHNTDTHPYLRNSRDLWPFRLRSSGRWAYRTRGKSTVGGYIWVDVGFWPPPTASGTTNHTTACTSCTKQKTSKQYSLILKCIENTSPRKWKFSHHLHKHDTTFYKKISNTLYTLTKKCYSILS